MSLVRLATGVACVVCAGQATSGTAISAGDTLLTDWPMLMTHDAATGYLTDMLNPVYAWARTQPSALEGFTAQLNCGARALDFRAHVNDKKELVFHHGSISVDRRVDDALAEIAAWAARNAAAEDLVVLSSWDCTGEACDGELASAFQRHNFTVVSSCDTLTNLTLSKAASLGALPCGGSVLVLPDCSRGGGYSEKNACSGFDGPGQLLRDGSAADERCYSLPSNSTFEQQQACGEKLRSRIADHNSADSLIPGYYDCWEGATNRDFALDRLLKYLGQYSAVAPAPGRFVQVQSLWQESVSSVVVGVAHLSSLLEDEKRSGLNALMVDRINADFFGHIGLFEVNNVCDHGQELKTALRAFHDRKKVRRDTVLV